MDRDRGRDNRRGTGEVTKMGGGESYRPAARSPPRDDLFRDRGRVRSPRRERARTPPFGAGDSWHPGGRDRSPIRRRSRTPPRRDRSPMRDNWRARPRSPRARSPPRRYSPRRDDDRRRSPPRRDDRRRSRSPYDRDRPAPRARSPLRRSPPPQRTNTYRPRSRSPDRRDIRNNAPQAASTWRRRSPSPLARDGGNSSGINSGNTSRRSSPPIHPDRLHLTQPTQQSRATPIRDHSPLPQQQERQFAYRGKEGESAKSTPRERSPVRPTVPRSPPRGPAAYRPPPTGPSGGRNFTAPIQQSRPIVPVSAHQRPENSGPVVPPSGPRGYIPPIRGGPYGMRGGRGSFSNNDRIIRPDPNTWKPAPAMHTRPTPEIINTRGSTPISRPAPSASPKIPSGPSTPVIPTGPANGIPTGPRAGIPSRPNLLHSSSVYGPRINNNSLSNNPSSSSNPLNNNLNNGPRPHPAMANMPAIITGGRIDPTATGMNGETTIKLNRKMEEEEVLREELNAKQEKLRVGLREWERVRRDSGGMKLKTELSEGHVRMLAGEGVGGAAF